MHAYCSLYAEILEDLQTSPDYPQHADYAKSEDLLIRLLSN